MTYVLVVDADASARHATIALVRSLAPVPFVSGVAELKHIWRTVACFEPELVIVDPAPYGVPGAQLLQLFRERYPDAGVLVLTSASATRRSVRGLPADVIVEKQLSPSQLREIISSVLHNRAAKTRETTDL